MVIQQENLMQEDGISMAILEHFNSSAPKSEKKWFLDAKKKVYYSLSLSGTQYHLSFWIDTYAAHRHDWQTELKNLFPSDTAQRDYAFCSSYGARGVKCRKPSLTAKDLKEDLGALRSRLERLERIVHATERALSGDLPVGIGEDVVLALIGRKLTIPPYQREYCWKKENILGLLEDLSRWQRTHGDKVYRVGTVILKRHSEGYDVIDGQQRILTFALLALQTKQRECFDNIQLGSSNQTRRAIDAMSEARQIIGEWLNTHERIDLEQVVMGIVVVGPSQSEDLSFNFFNHLNSSGVPLTDYELLKGHHLRYVKEDGTAEIMDRRWQSLDREKDDKFKEHLLHLCLFRIRKWLGAKAEGFHPAADRRESHDLFREFSLDFEPLSELCTPYKPVEINSLISGGIEFFDYAERFRRLFKTFLEQKATQDIAPLGGHSNGTLYEGIWALSFMFFCKFGEIYLSEATYAIAWTVSRIRTEKRVQRDFIGKRDEFRKVATVIARATHEGEVLGCLLNRMELYSIEKEKSGNTANKYWLELRAVAKKLQNSNSLLVKQGLNFIDSLTEEVWQKTLRNQ